jgi:hypothetical protein
MDEFKEWALGIIEQSADPPKLLVDLLDFQGPVSHIYGIIGFVPRWPFPPAAKAAVASIAKHRGRASDYAAAPVPDLEEAKATFPQVYARFREAFPVLVL